MAIRPTPAGPLRPLLHFGRDRRGFTGAEKALLICFGLAVVTMVGYLVSSGGKTAAGAAKRTLSGDWQASGSWQLGLAPQKAGELPAPGAVEKTSDLKAADQALKGKLQIVPADFKGARLPNQLTQAEYDKVVKLYADIAAGKTDIKFNAADLRKDPKFMAGVMNDFSAMMQTATGRDLLGRLANQPSGHTVTFGVNRDAAGNPDTTNAFADAPTPGERSKWGDGKGVSAIVHYVPGHDVNLPGATDSWIPIRGDVVIFHEMVHALHIVNGTMDDSLIRSGHGDPDDVGSGIRNSEYQAVGLGDHVGDAVTENKYRAERRRIGKNPGSLPGDSTMPQRDHYVVHTAPSGPPP